jgi:hypothetical protein
MTLRIAQISDTHLSPRRGYFTANFDRVAEVLAADGPDLVINTGDLALNGADEDGDLELAVARHRGLRATTLLLPGNHDVGDSIGVGSAQPITAERLARYRRIVGPDHWRIDVAGWRLLGINAQLLGTGLAEVEAHLAAIRDAAAGLHGRALALFLHKPVADLALQEAEISNRMLTPTARRELLDALGGVTPAFVACGHVHQYRVSRFGGAEHIWAPATSFIISDPWQPVFGAKCVGYVEHLLEPDGHHRHRLVTPRDLAHLDLVGIPEAYGDVRQWGHGKA